MDHTDRERMFKEIEEKVIMDYLLYNKPIVIMKDLLVRLGMIEVAAEIQKMCADYQAKMEKQIESSRT